MKKKVELIGLAAHGGELESYLILLEEIESKYRIPIIIGSTEAQSIVIAIKKVIPPRPFSHDSFYTIMKEFGLSVLEAYIHTVKDGVFHAVLIVKNFEKKEEIDMRASDAISLALRFDAPIYVNESVLAEASLPPLSENLKLETPLEIKQKLEEAIKNENYELAAELRDKINKIEKNNIFKNF